jgi:SpoVK/Ycf46/Vps4 family AAA+-type ATPase
LFFGASGTGKTMAAQVLAKRLECELWRIDLSRVVDKYVGETEKNLDRVFAAAEQHGALLFFDEADALFGKRTAVRDAHDRFANIEVAFLLQRMERHPGIVVLATNLASNIDGAFSRRTQMVVEFPAPGVEHRLEIWQRHLVADRLGRDVDLAYLSRTFDLTGGQIRNAVVAAVLLAAQRNDVIEMRDLVIAVWRELVKSGRMTNPADFGSWQRDIIGYTAASRP